jgi:hypothetical protein
MDTDEAQHSATPAASSDPRSSNPCVGGAYPSGPKLEPHVLMVTAPALAVDPPDLSRHLIVVAAPPIEPPVARLSERVVVCDPPDGPTRDVESLGVEPAVTHSLRVITAMDLPPVAAARRSGRRNDKGRHRNPEDTDKPPTQHTTHKASSRRPLLGAYPGTCSRRKPAPGDRRSRTWSRARRVTRQGGSHRQGVASIGLSLMRRQDRAAFTAARRSKAAWRHRERSR